MLVDLEGDLGHCFKSKKLYVPCITVFKHYNM